MGRDVRRCQSNRGCRDDGRERVEIEGSVLEAGRSLGGRDAAGCLVVEAVMADAVMLTAVDGDGGGVSAGAGAGASHHRGSRLCRDQVGCR